MEIYLIRHTTPDIQKGMCYGQYDLNTTGSFEEEVRCIKPHLPASIGKIYSSPLTRCKKLAETLFPQHPIQYDDRLKEINCGAWEMRLWDEIQQEELQAWMSDFVNATMPEGESYLKLYKRVIDFFTSIPVQDSIAIVSHGGVIRSLLSHIENVELVDSFKAFSIRYGCVIKVLTYPHGFSHQVLHNPEAEKEQHRPSCIKLADAKL